MVALTASGYGVCPWMCTLAQRSKVQQLYLLLCRTVYRNSIPRSLDKPKKQNFARSSGCIFVRVCVGVHDQASSLATFHERSSRTRYKPSASPTKPKAQAFPTVYYAGLLLRSLTCITKMWVHSTSWGFLAIETYVKFPNSNSV